MDLHGGSALILRLTAANVRTLPAQRRTDYRDATLRGLVLRVSPTGARSFALAYSRHGKNRRYTLGPTPPLTLAEAREEGRKILARIALGDDPQAVRAAARRGITVAQLVDLALAALILKPSTRRQWEWLAEKDIKPGLGTIRAADLTRGEIREWGASVAKRSAYTAHHAFRLLRRCFSWGVEVDRLQATPFLHLRGPAEGQIRQADRVLFPEELRALLLTLDEFPGAYADAVLLLLLTMVRREAVLGMRLSELEAMDGEEPRWTVPPERSKSGRAHVVPLSPQAVTVIGRARARPGVRDVLFPPVGRSKGHGGHMAWSSDWIDYVRARMVKLHGAAIPRWTVHDLRRTAATLLRERLGVERDLIRLLLGHAAPGVLSVYERAERLSERRAALVSWAAWIDALRVSQAPAKVLPHRARGASGARR